MNYKSTMQIAFVITPIVLLLNACATPRNPETRNVRIISEEQSKKCYFIDTISSYDVAMKYQVKEATTGARNSAMNIAAARGGNALWIKSIDSKSEKNKEKVFVIGDAFKCP